MPQVTLPLPKRPFVSKTYTWPTTGAGGTETIDLSFLDAALARFRWPVIDRLQLLCNIQGDVGAALGPARLFPQVITQLMVKDVQDQICNLDGHGLRRMNQVELGMGYRDGATWPNANNNTRRFSLWLPWNMVKAERGKDCCMPVLCLRRGEMTINWLAATALGIANQITTIDSFTVQFIAWVREMHKGELPARHKWERVALTQQEALYPIGGFARFIGLEAGRVAENAAAFAGAWGAHNVESQTLEIPTQDRGMHEDLYLQSYIAARGDAAGNVTQEDGVANDFLVPLAFPTQEQQITDLYDLPQTCHIKTSATITASNEPQVYKYVLTPPNEAWEMAALRCESIDELRAAKKLAQIKQGDGRRKAPAMWNQRLRAVMPKTFAA